MNPSSAAHRHGDGQYPTIAGPGRYQIRRTSSTVYVTPNASPTLRFPSPSVSENENVPFVAFRRGSIPASVVPPREYVALYSESGRTADTAQTTTRWLPVEVSKSNATCGSTGFPSFWNPRGRNTIASIARRTSPDRRDARRSFRAAGGGEDRRLNIGFFRTGRGIRTASLHVDRRAPRDREAGAPLRVLDPLRVRVDDLDFGLEFVLEEAL